MTPLEARRLRLSIAGALHDTIHAVHFYETEEFLLETLTSFVASGITSHEAVIVVATPEHRAQLDERLAASGIAVPQARDAGTYVTVDAAELLSRFRDGTIDASRFHEVVGGLIARARGEGTRPVRVFGEMVALLWAEGDPAAAIELESLWNELGRKMSFALLCAYPTSLFEEDRSPGEIAEITKTHTPGIITLN